MATPDSPFETDKAGILIVHCCYHKSGTVWFSRVLRKVARFYDLNFQKEEQNALGDGTDIFVQKHSRIDTALLPDFAGSHMIRDPRDIVISGYFYHLWTSEKWANKPQEKFGMLSYKQYLNQLDQNEGLMAEIGRINNLVSRMLNWNYDDTRFLELKYEDIIENEQLYFQKMFKHYGFHEQAIQKACRIADSCSFKNVTQRKKGHAEEGNHLRSGKSGQWRQIFSNEHKNYFKSLYPGALVNLGYEENDNW